VTENIAEGQTAKEREAMLWHRRFGHLSSQSLQHVAEHTAGLPEPVKAIKEACDMCKCTKAVRVVNRRAPEWTKTALQQIHSDICGPFSVATPYGDTYFAMFTDGMYQRSDFISDFRARRIHTQITWENLSAIRDSFPGAGSSGTRTGFQWVTHEASMEGVGLWVGGGVLEPLVPSDFLGKSWEMSSSPQSPGNHRQRILGFLGSLFESYVA
jgi:hypothetical protein